MPLIVLQLSTTEAIQDMKLESEDKSKAVVVRVIGRMDAVSAPEFDQACAKLFSGGAKNLVVDLDQMDYISSAGLRSILAAGKTLKGQGGQLVLCSLKGMVKEIFEISGFVSVFPVFPSAEDAVSHV
jgi:anti-anti-sigma factor